MPDRDAIIAAIEGFRGLTDNWDGQGAAAPSSGVIDTALTLARLFFGPWPASVTATPAGSILFAGERDGGGYGELEVAEPGRAEWMSVDLDWTAHHGEFLVEGESVVMFTSRLGKRPSPPHDLASGGADPRD